mmetsp:Transcript_5573/g.10001  ORF Transcript_5573/g.10001 Transcript_5573/m.10001 type:complete len:235 (-) Transcript_5573:70-774(-)
MLNVGNSGNALPTGLAEFTSGQTMHASRVSWLPCSMSLRLTDLTSPPSRSPHHSDSKSSSVGTGRSIISELASSRSSIGGGLSATSLPLPLAAAAASAGFKTSPIAFMASAGGTGTSSVWPTLALAGTLTKMTAPGTFGCGIWTVAPGSPRFMVMTVFGPGGTNGLLDSFQSLGGRTGRSFFVPLLICTILFKSKIYSCPRDRTFSSSEPAIRARFKTLSSSASRSFHSAPSFT